MRINLEYQYIFSIVSIFILNNCSSVDTYSLLSGCDSREGYGACYSLKNTCEKYEEISDSTATDGVICFCCD